MEKINNYTIITSATHFDLIHKVSDHLLHGWVPAGGISIANKDGEIVLAQAMVK